jgi:hypothetical protein
LEIVLPCGNLPQSGDLNECKGASQYKAVQKVLLNAKFHGIRGESARKARKQDKKPRVASLKQKQAR